VLPVAVEASINEIRMKFKAADYVSQGEHQDHCHTHQHFDDAGIDYINFEGDDNKVYGSNITVAEILRWNNHPFLYNLRLYKVEGWMDFVISIADKMESSARSWGGSILSRDMPRVKMLRDFIEKHKE
jgi:hypothetical protein